MWTADCCATGWASRREEAARKRVVHKDHFNTVSRRATLLMCVVSAGWWWLGTAAPRPRSATAPASTVQQMQLQREEFRRAASGDEGAAWLLEDQLRCCPVEEACCPKEWRWRKAKA